MGITFEKKSFAKKLRSMLNVDIRRMFTMPLVYIMTVISLVMPILILVMTAMMGDSEGNGEATSTFTDVWQSIGSLSGTRMSTDITGMCNINLMYFLVAVMVCIFVADDFKSGYAKNLFAVRSKKIDYVMSKYIVTFIVSIIMFAAYFIGAMIGGAIAQLSFGTSGFGAGGVVACMLSKIFIISVFVSIAVLLGVVSKQKLWLSIVGSFAAGMLLFTMIPMIAPIDANMLNVIMCLAGGAMFSLSLGAVSNVVLNKTNTV